MYSSRAYTSSLNSAIGSSVWLIVSLILAIVGGILVYFLFLNKKNEGKFTGFVAWLYDFLIWSNFLLFLGTLLVGNLVVRIIYEFSLILLVICRNTTEIAKNTKKSDDK